MSLVLLQSLERRFLMKKQNQRKKNLQRKSSSLKPSLKRSGDYSQRVFFYLPINQYRFIEHYDMLTSGDDSDHDITLVNLVNSNPAFRTDLQSNPGSLFLKKL